MNIGCEEVWVNDLFMMNTHKNGTRKQDSK